MSQHAAKPSDSFFTLGKIFHKRIHKPLMETEGEADLRGSQKGNKGKKKGLIFQDHILDPPMQRSEWTYFADESLRGPFIPDKNHPVTQKLTMETSGK
ncbi:hypothetical protein BaRGS_00020142 [Batillaria attramentaria]|uniref:Uncharacterized protein n=1 Tax=Batillaria attramentaria TaxID=370345 RepID=A0ABD0KNL2_9CAEN